MGALHVLISFKRALIVERRGDGTWHRRGCRAGRSSVARVGASERRQFEHALGAGGICNGSRLCARPRHAIKDKRGDGSCEQCADARFGAICLHELGTPAREDTGMAEELLKDAIWRGDQGQRPRLAGNSQIRILVGNRIRWDVLRVLFGRVSQAGWGSSGLQSSPLKSGGGRKTRHGTSGFSFCQTHQMLGSWRRRDIYGKTTRAI